MPSMNDIDMELRIRLAEYGDREPLVEALRAGRTIPPWLQHKALAAAWASDAPRLPPHKTYHWLMAEKHKRERMVDWLVEGEMRIAGRQRDSERRGELIPKWCKYCGLREDLYHEFKKRGGSWLRSTPHKEVMRRLAKR